MIVVQVFTLIYMRRILHYVYIEENAALGKRDTKTERLRQQGALNRHPETVGASWFQTDGFFDARDLVQVKYEMLRHVRVDGVQKASAAALFGVSRPTFYQAEADFAQDGLAGLLPKPRGPKSAHKLTPEVMTFIETQRVEERAPGARSLARQIRAELGLSVHPRSIERALARKKKR
jgi:transposase